MKEGLSVLLIGLIVRPNGFFERAQEFLATVLVSAPGRHFTTQQADCLGIGNRELV
jgi:hypothetical protein